MLVTTEQLNARQKRCLVEAYAASHRNEPFLFVATRQLGWSGEEANDIADGLGQLGLMASKFEMPTPLGSEVARMIIEERKLTFTLASLCKQVSLGFVKHVLGAILSGIGGLIVGYVAGRYGWRK